MPFEVRFMRHPPVEGGEGRCYGRFDLPLAAGWERIVDGWEGAGDLYASPAQRCRRAAARLGETVVIDPRLAELDFGEWEGRLWNDIPRAELDAWAEDMRGTRVGGGESVAMMEKRVTAFWTELVTHGRPARVVTHGGPLRVLLALAEGRAWAPDEAPPPQGACIAVMCKGGDRMESSRSTAE